MIHFFIDRPIFASVISIVITIVGVTALIGLPVAQYPEVAPPSIRVEANYPGANAQTVADTVAAPIEQEVNGVEDMLYMSSVCTNDGRMVLTITFTLGTNLDMAQVLVQNRVAIALPKIPQEAQRQGVTTKKQSPSILQVINLISPSGERDQLYLSNYATINVKDALARVEGVGDVSFLGARDYSMRIWLDPDKLASRSMTADDVVEALREQNVQVAAGRIGQEPVREKLNFQLSINTQGRLLTPEEFDEVVVRTGEEGRVTRVKDIGRSELGAKNYDVNSYLDGQECISLGVYQLPGSNAVATAQRIRDQMEALKRAFPQGVDYRIHYDTTIFISESIAEVYSTLFEACVLVLLVILVFLRAWRPTAMPLIAIPVSLIGSFAVMSLFGFSLNNLSLFGIVLAIGIVVDDAIVVLENVERLMKDEGLEPRPAAKKAMDQMTGAVIATSLVVLAVFVPCAFITGITGQFYRQFALTISAAVAISTVNALTLTPAMCAVILRRKPEDSQETKTSLSAAFATAVVVGYFVWKYAAAPVSKLVSIEGPVATYGVGGVIFLLGAVVGWFVFVKFEELFNPIIDRYAKLVKHCVSGSPIVMLTYAGLMFVTYVGFTVVPTGFIPQQDKGYVLVNVQLPDGASLSRTEAVMDRVDDMIMETEGVAHTIRVPGYSLVNAANLTNMGAIFVILEDFDSRKDTNELYADSIANDLRGKFASLQEAVVVAFGAPPVDGLGATGGFKLQVQDRGGLGPEYLQGITRELSEAGNAQPGLVGVNSTFRANQPQIYLDIDRVKAKAMQVPLNEVFSALQTYLGSVYVNDFTRFGRNWQVNVQADSRFRSNIGDIGRLQIRNSSGNMVPLATLVQVREVSGPALVNRYNMYRSAEVSGNMVPGTSSGQAISMMSELAGQKLPPSMSFEWTELSLQEILAGNTAALVFVMGSVFVFLVLSAQYESWSLPLAILLIVPMCLLAAITGVWLKGSDNNIFTQIGFVVLIGLSAKNAILIVEFAKQRQDEGLSRSEAAVESARLRLRPILMTAFSFILGVIPLITATGAGAEMRVALGVAVFSGMLGVTIFGLLFTPVFYNVVMWFGEIISRDKPAAVATAAGATANPADAASQ